MDALRKIFGWKSILLAFSGGLAGYAYYRTVGCVTGTCPISGNPYTASIFGAVLGFILSPRTSSK